MSRVRYGGGQSARMSNPFMSQAIDLARENVRRAGGPFAALVVKEGVVIATGVNRVTRDKDPTAHAEIVAIREACRLLGAFQLDCCDVYASCEPCPMCLGALYWARPARVYFAASSADAAAAGFDDSLIYSQLGLPPAQRSIPMVQTPDERATLPFELWLNTPGRERY